MAPGLTVLPRTRSFHRARPQRVWWLAAAIGIVLNGGVVIGLSQVSHLHQPPPPGLPMTVRRLKQPDPVPPPPAPAVAEASEETTDPPAAEMPTVALPPLELPATSASTSGIALPDLATLDPDAAWSAEVPPLAVAGPAMDAPALPPSLPSGPPAIDTPAQRLGAIDLDRHYPRAARARGISGTSRIRIAIDAHGKVERVEVLESNPPEVFDAAAERVGREQRYARPAMAGGKPIASLQDITIEWTIR